MEISIPGSKQTKNIAESLLQNQPPCGIIRTTADYFLLPYCFHSVSMNPSNFSDQMPVDTTNARKARRIQLGIPKCRHENRMGKRRKLQTPFPRIQKAGFVNECINDWTDTLHLLAPDWGGLLWLRLNSLTRIMALVKKRALS
jgi:hypothetical protein